MVQRADRVDYKDLVQFKENFLSLRNPQGILETY